MSWKDCMEEWGGGDIAFLSEDGEAIIFIVVADPVLLTGRFKGRQSERIGCPVITQEGYTLFITGKRVARRLSRYEDKFDSHAFMLVRRGEHNDIETSYDLTVCQDPELTKKLFDWKDAEFDPAAVEQSVKDAESIVSS